MIALKDFIVFQVKFLLSEREIICIQTYGAACLTGDGGEGAAGGGTEIEVAGDAVARNSNAARSITGLPLNRSRQSAADNIVDIIAVIVL